MSFFSIRKFLKSLKCALRGFYSVYKTEQNFRFQLILALIVIILIFVFKVTRKEAVLLLLMITFVLAMELINSVFEKFTDMLKPRIHFYAELVKDIMSGAVLLSSVAALVVGIIIFLPYFSDLLKTI